MFANKFGILRSQSLQKISELVTKLQLYWGNEAKQSNWLAAQGKITCPNSKEM